MATYTPRYGLKKPAPEDFYNVQDQNDNMDAIDAALAGDIDCGTFGDAGPVALHDASVTAHPLLVVDGNGDGVPAAAGTLEEHIIDPLAHQNIRLDGNMS